MKEYKNNLGELHRLDDPAVENNSGDKFWYINGKLHREDGPAIEYNNGDKWWYINGREHRTDGPAVEYNNGDKYWCINGEIHREDGPAIVRISVSGNIEKEWVLNNVVYSEEEYKHELIKLKLKRLVDL